MAVLSSRLGEWHLDHVHAWADRQLVIRAEPARLLDPATKVATIGSCFAKELAQVMGTVGILGGMHPGGLFYSTATIRQELERIAGGWSERSVEPTWNTPAGLIDPFRDYDTAHADEAALLERRHAGDTEADALFRDAGLVVITLGLIETWRNPATGNTFRQIPHPAVFPSLGAEFHRLTVGEMLADLERIRAVVRDNLGAQLVLTTSPVPLHTTFTPLDVRVANTESKSRIRAAVSEFVDSHPDVRYFHSYEMVVTAEKQSDYFREDGRHVHRHAVQYIVAEFLRQFADPAVWLDEVDTSWLTEIAKTAPTPAPETRAKPSTPPRARSPVRPASLPKRLARRLWRSAASALGRASTR